ncbi:MULTISPECIES: hypothetical protein [unclassified Streptomyces]|uniref:hypothetical protein n=1 Tax=unclassified Streptomyces TaxID=2593676 RepID=UPI002E2A0788|nr:hypothetical protein [Streptomyces sp. NBC_00223]
MAGVSASVVAAGGLIGGYGIARWTKRRELGGVALVAAGAVAARQWSRDAGSGTAAGLTGAYVAAFAGAHPLAKKIGSWPAVFTTAATVAALSWTFSDRRTK